MKTNRNNLNSFARGMSLCVAIVGLSVLPVGSALAAPVQGAGANAIAPSDPSKPVIGPIVSQTSMVSADWDHSGSVTPNDLFEYLKEWLARDAAADLNGDGTITVSDLFEFLEMWFAGFSGTPA